MIDRLVFLPAFALLFFAACGKTVRAVTEPTADAIGTAVVTTVTAVGAAVADCLIEIHPGTWLGGPSADHNSGTEENLQKMQLAAVDELGPWRYLADDNEALINFFEDCVERSTLYHYIDIDITLRLNPKFTSRELSISEDPNGTFQGSGSAKTHDGKTMIFSTGTSKEDAIESYRRTPSQSRG